MHALGFPARGLRGMHGLPRMPCAKCAKKIQAIATPEVKNASNRPVAVNKLIEKKADRLVGPGAKCSKCGAALHLKAKLCSTCAHRNGRCNICGRKIVDVSRHCMSIV